MTSNLTICYMAAKANEPHVEREAIHASRVAEALAGGRETLANTRNPMTVAQSGLINRLLTSIAGMRGAALTRTDGLGAGD